MLSLVDDGRNPEKASDDGEDVEDNVEMGLTYI